MAGRRWMSWIASLSLVGSLLVFGGSGVAQAAPSVPAITPATPVIAGNAKVGKALTARTDTWQPAPVTLAYQWYRSGAAITGATARTYTLVAADKGKTVTVKVTGTKEGFAPVARTSKPTSKVAAGTLAAVTPKITGTVKVGKTLTANPGTWKPAPVALKFQWYRSGKAVSKATKATYKLGTADLGKQITVKVTGTKAGYDKVAKTSKKTKKVAAGSLTTVAPTISGSAIVGKTLTVKRGTWAPSGVKFSYQWYRSGKKIAKATKSTYKVVSADKGKKLTVKVTGSKKGYATTTKTSAATAVVVLPTYAGTPTITGYQALGVPMISAFLTANPGSWKPSGMTFTYRWYANGVAIPGASASRIRVTPALIGKRITVAATGKRAGYATVTKTSAATPAVSPDGIYISGDLPTGNYLAKGGSQCAWWRLSSLDIDIATADLGTPGVLGMSLEHSGQTIAAVNAGELYFVSFGCGQWTPLPSTPALRTSVGDGDYAVGIHVEPGVWASAGVTSQCYLEFATGFAGNEDEIIDYGTPSGSSIMILPSDTRFSSVGCGTWTRQGPLPADPGTSTGLKRMTGARPTSTLDGKDVAKLIQEAEHLTESAVLESVR